MRNNARVKLAVLAVGLAAALVPIPMTVAPALADEIGNLYLSPNNASDPDMQECVSGGVLGYCMYTSQDLNEAGNYPMSNTLGFFSTDGLHWTAQGNNGVIFSESAYVNRGWVQSGAKHLWAPTMYRGGGDTYYLFVPDVSDTSQQHSSSFIGVSVSTSGPFGPFTPMTRITNTMPDPNNFNQPWNGGYASDPAIFHESVRGGGTYLVFANGDTSSRNCGNISIAALDTNTMSISNPQIIAINGIGALGVQSGSCISTGMPYLEGASLYRTDLSGWGPGAPGPYLLAFAAKPTSRPAACASNLGQPNTANEVIAYAVAPTVTGPYTYKGILMCGSSTEWTNQATLMPLKTADSVDGNVHRAIAMYYHDGPSGNHNRKVHAQCLAFGGGNFAATMRPVSTSQGFMPSFTECMAGDVKSSWGFQQPNGQMLTTLLNVSGVANGTVNSGLGRVAMGHYERFEVADSNGAFTQPAGLIGFTGTISGADLFSHANLKWVADQGVCESAFASSYFPRYSLNLTWDENTKRENVVIVNQGALTNLNGQGGCLTTGTFATTFNLMHYYNNFPL
jgi:hypothetical protein